MVRKVTLFLSPSIRTYLVELREETKSSMGYARAMELYADLITHGTSPWHYSMKGLASAERSRRLNDFFEMEVAHLDEVFRKSQRIEAHVIRVTNRDPSGIRLELRAYLKESKMPWAMCVFTFAEVDGACAEVHSNVERSKLRRM